MCKKDSDANKILKYLEDQNRPYSVNDLLQNLHKEIGKTAVQKSLDALVADGAVKEKCYGKQKVYVINQEIFQIVDENELKNMDIEFARLSEEIKEQEQLISEAQSKYKVLSSCLTTEDAAKSVNQLTGEFSSLESKLQNLQQNQVLISKEELESVKKRREASVKEWKKRKRIALEMLDAILEGYPKSKNDLYEETGIDTDDDIGIKMIVL